MTSCRSPSSRRSADSRERENGELGVRCVWHSRRVAGCCTSRRLQEEVCKLRCSIQLSRETHTTGLVQSKGAILTLLLSTSSTGARRRSRKPAGMGALSRR
ncbi:hypothetical protein V8C44DRAFT_321880 [Trichoderma aethiopicum]